MRNVDPRLFRSFLAVAQELHFGRAAARLYVAQQALSRDIARLERELGVPLFVRSTRRVALTLEGERLVPRAAELLALHDQILDEMRGSDQPLMVDALRDRSTASRVLSLARELAPDLEIEGRFHGGFGAAYPELLAHRLDVIFGRSTGFGLPFPDHLTRRLVRLEPVGLLMLEDHPLAAQPAIPLADVAGLTLDTSAGNVAAPEWVQLATELVVDHGGIPSPEHHPGMPAVAAAGPDETAYHLRATGWPIISLLDVPQIPGAVVRPFTDPIPLYPWTMVHRRNLNQPALAALNQAIDAPARTQYHATPHCRRDSRQRATTPCTGASTGGVDGSGVIGALTPAREGHLLRKVRYCIRCKWTAPDASGSRAGICRGQCRVAGRLGAGGPLVQARRSGVPPAGQAHRPSVSRDQSMALKVMPA